MDDDHILTVRLRPSDYAALQRDSEEKGVPMSTCARMLMKEGLRLQQPAARARVLLSVIEDDLELRLLLRRLVLTLPKN